MQHTAHLPQQVVSAMCLARRPVCALRLIQTSPVYPRPCTSLHAAGWLGPWWAAWASCWLRSAAGASCAPPGAAARWAACTCHCAVCGLVLLWVAMRLHVVAAQQPNCSPCCPTCDAQHQASVLQLRASFHRPLTLVSPAPHTHAGRQGWAGAAGRRRHSVARRPPQQRGRGECRSVGQQEFGTGLCCSAAVAAAYGGRGCHEPFAAH